MSTLVGIAIERGAMRLDQTVGETLDAVVTGIEPETRAITLRHLLTMTSGLPWRELDSAEQDCPAWVSSPDPLRWILDRPLDHATATGTTTPAAGHRARVGREEERVVDELLQAGDGGLVLRRVQGLPELHVRAGRPLHTAAGGTPATSGAGGRR